MDFPDNIKNYFQLLGQWMGYFGLAPVSIEKNWLFDVSYARDKVDASKFGKVNTFCFIKYADEIYDFRKLELFSSECFNYAMKIRKGNPLGFGGMLVVYPCLIVDCVSKDLADFIKKYVNKHFAASEFPSLLDISTGDIYFNQRTPIWGALYYEGFRKESRNLFSPKSWSLIAGNK